MRADQTDVALNSLVMRARAVVAELAQARVKAEARIDPAVAKVINEASDLIAELVQARVVEPVVSGSLRSKSSLFKFKDNPTRIIFTDEELGPFREHKGKVFGVIGPFSGFGDKTDLQDAIVTLLTGYNLETTP